MFINFSSPQRLEVTHTRQRELKLHGFSIAKVEKASFFIIISYKLGSNPM